MAEKKQENEKGFEEKYNILRNSDLPTGRKLNPKDKDNLVEKIRKKEALRKAEKKE